MVRINHTCFEVYFSSFLLDIVWFYLFVSVQMTSTVARTLILNSTLLDAANIHITWDISGICIRMGD